MGLADHAGAGRGQARHRGGSDGLHRVRLQPHRVAEAGARAGDVIQVLDAEAQAGERTAHRPRQFGMRMPAKRPQRVAVENRRVAHGAWISTGLREKLMRPPLKPYSGIASSDTASSGVLQSSTTRLAGLPVSMP